MSNRILHAARKALGWQKLLVFRMPLGAPAIELRHEVIDLTAGMPSGIPPGIPPGPAIPWKDEVLRMRFGTGSRLFALSVEGRLVSFAWISSRPRFQADELGRELQSETPLIWIWDCVTPAEHRGRGYFPELICHLASQSGQRNTAIFVRTDNLSSVRGIIKAGFLPWMEIAATRWNARIRQIARFEGGLNISSRPSDLRRIFGWLPSFQKVR